MIFLRIAFIAVVLWIAMRLVRRVLDRPRKEKMPDSYRGKMVACATCGVYLPESEAMVDGAGRATCGKH